MSGTLHKYFLNNSGKEIHKLFHYFDIYERHFEKYRHLPINVLEIGVSQGGSLQMWKDYFGSNAKIVGIDIDPECKAHEEKNVEVFIGNQTDEDLAKEIYAKYGPFDIIIDDGSHIMSDVVKSFQMYYPIVKPNGTYLVEDLHTSYWEGYGGGLKREGTFIELCKDLIDVLNANYSPNMIVDQFTKSTDSMNFYDSVVVFEKRPQSQRNHIKIKGM